MKFVNPQENNLEKILEKVPQEQQIWAELIYSALNSRVNETSELFNKININLTLFKNDFDRFLIQYEKDRLQTKEQFIQERKVSDDAHKTNKEYADAGFRGNEKFHREIMWWMVGTLLTVCLMLIGYILTTIL